MGDRSFRDLSGRFGVGLGSNRGVENGGSGGLRFGG